MNTINVLILSFLLVLVSPVFAFQRMVLSSNPDVFVSAFMDISATSASGTNAPYHTSDLVNLSFTIHVASEHRGARGEVYLLGIFDNTVMQKDRTNKWITFNEMLMPYMSYEALPETVQINVLNNYSGHVGNLEFYAGYKLYNSDTIIYNKIPVRISITPFAPLSRSINIKESSIKNLSAYITSQCYTKTKTGNGNVYNPCYSCHQKGRIPNYTNDEDFQLSYDFSEYSRKNPWTNLFWDKSGAVTTISDDDILAYVRNDNYLGPDGQILLAKRLQMLPDSWDHDGDGKWSGYVPDCYFNFDSQGFDRSPTGDYTGWRAFAYYPFLGTFWPTNGSIDDVIIRLSEDFRKNEHNVFDLEVYRINLAIVEALIKREDVKLDNSVDEKLYQVDLDKDGKLGTALKIKYDWAPLESRNMSYVGMARIKQIQDKVHLAAGLFPEGTEFLHSVRYVDVKPDGSTGMARRMKELRYARKAWWMSYAALQELALDEVKEKHDFPDRLRQIVGNMEYGLSNDQGWIYQGFIEDANGHLRPQSYEETVFCIGCHSGIGATTDGIFSFPRKFSAEKTYRNGWYHWSQRDLKGTVEPKVEIEGSGVQYEYSYYLMYNNAGNEFRDNDEVIEKFFNKDGSIKADMLIKLHDDITVLLNPSESRALKLNKAYRVIVAEQSFDKGRDANIKPTSNVYDEVPQNELTGVKKPSNYTGQPFVFSDWAFDMSSPIMGSAFEYAVLGSGMAGPDGRFYEVSRDGLIHKSTYSLGIQGYYFPFPSRLTVPTRVIVPNANIPSCYTCHRLYGPVPAQEPIIKTPVEFSASSMTEKEKTVLTRLTFDAADDLGGVWSPDSKKIAWVSGRPGAYQIWVMNSDGTGKQQLTNNGLNGWPQWSPDGSRLVFWSYDSVNGKHAIKLISADGIGIKTLVESSEHLDRPQWSPDGRHIAYTAVQNGNWDVWAITVDNAGAITNSYRLTTDPQMESNPLWHPNGNFISYKVAPLGDYNLTEENFLSLVNGLANPEVYKWNGPESVQMNAWSPDGKKIAYTVEGINQAVGIDRITYMAVVSDVTTQGQNVVTFNTKVVSKGITLGDRGPVFSPDSTKVVFWAWDSSFRATLWLYNLETNSLYQLTSFGMDMYPQWSPDGQKILFESSRSGNMDLWSMPVN